MQDITKYTKKDFEGTAPYEYLYSLRGNAFTEAQMKIKLADHAKSVGYSSFKATYAKYCKSIAGTRTLEIADNTAEFPQLEEALRQIEIRTGVWEVDPDTGAIVKPTEKGSIVACSHFICPVKTLIDVETGREKIEMLWIKPKKTAKQVFERADLANASKVVGLAAYGVSVTSETARALVSWINDASDLNADIIPVVKSVSRLGYIGDFGFSPYAEGLTYDGGVEYADIYKAIAPQGSYEKWIERMKEVRADNRLAPRIMLAASFASVLVEPLHAYPFFIHLYGGSGNGKTVALHMAASVWGNPQSYVKTFNATKVGMEMLAGFLHNLPLCLDELQIQRTQGADFENIIYDLSEGTGRTRGNKLGGLRNTATWRNTILTTGETPMVTAASAGGVANRVIELDTTDLEHLFDGDTKLVRLLQKNHGHAGKEFVAKITEKRGTDLEAWVEMKDYYQSELIKRGITDKQATIASILLVADTLINDFIFHDSQLIEVDELARFLKTNAQVSENRKAYEWLRGWIAQNRSKFNQWGHDDSYRQDLYGTFATDEKSVRIIKNVFDSACNKEGFDPSNFVKWLKRENYTFCDGDRCTRRARIHGLKQTIQVIDLKLEDSAVDVPEGFEEMGPIDPNDDKPF